MRSRGFGQLLELGFVVIYRPPARPPARPIHFNYTNTITRWMDSAIPIPSIQPYKNDHRRFSTLRIQPILPALLTSWIYFFSSAASINTSIFEEVLPKGRFTHANMANFFQLFLSDFCHSWSKHSLQMSLHTLPSFDLLPYRLLSEKVPTNLASTGTAREEILQMQLFFSNFRNPWFNRLYIVCRHKVALEFALVISLQ